MNSHDAELEQMLAKPEFMAQPIFSKERYLAECAHGLMGFYLRALNQPPEVFQEVRQAHIDACCQCLQVRPLFNGKKLAVVGWTFDLDAQQSTREAFKERARFPLVGMMHNQPRGIMEQVMVRRVLRIQVEPETSSPNAPPGTQIVRIKDLGWFAAGLVGPMKAPGV